MFVIFLFYLITPIFSNAFKSLLIFHIFMLRNITDYMATFISIIILSYLNRKYYEFQISTKFASFRVFKKLLEQPDRIILSFFVSGIRIILCTVNR